MRGTGFKITLSGLSLTGTNIKPLCWGSLRYPPPVQWFVRRTQSTRCIVLMSMIYCGERIQSKISKKQRLLGKGRESSPSGVSHDVPTSPGNELQQHVLNSYWGHSLGNQCPEILCGAGNVGTFCLMFQSSKLLEGKHVLSINYVVCTHNLDTVIHSYPGVGGTLPKSRSPDSGQGLTLQAGRSKDSSLRLVMLSVLCITPH